jgi:hypothetical protein
MKAHEEARAIAAPIVADVLADLARHLGCSVSQLDVLLCASVEASVLRGVGRWLEAEPGERSTPLVPREEYRERLDDTCPGFRLPRGVR